MAEVNPLKLFDQGGGVGALAEFGEGDTLPKDALPPLELSDVSGLSTALADKVSLTSDTGAAVLPSGTEAQRPTPTNGMFRYNTETNQFEGYQNGSWGAIGGAGADIDFTIIYPNGGSEGSPANVTANSRYLLDNPFPGFHVMSTVELFISGNWQTAGWLSDSVSGAAYGTQAGMFNNSIVVQTGLNAVTAGSVFTGGAGNLSAGTVASAPCRVKVWKVKGAVA